MQRSPLTTNQQFRLLNSSLLVLTLAAMVTQHKYKLPRRLKIRFDWYHCKELSLRHSPNLITALDFASRQRSQPLHTSTFYNSKLCTSLRTLLSSAIPPNWLQWQPLGFAVFDQLSIFRQLNGLPRSNHRVYRVHGDGTPSSCSRLQSALASSFQAVAKAPKPACRGCFGQHAAGPKFPFVYCLSTDTGDSRASGSRLLRSCVWSLDEQDDR